MQADLGQLNQVILNLALNSRDAMPQGGDLTLETSEADLDGADTKGHPEVRPGRYVLLTVTDTGSHDTEVQAHILSPFHQKSQRPGHGTGPLGGLGIIQQCGVTLNVERTDEGPNLKSTCLRCKGFQGAGTHKTLVANQ